MTWIKNVKTFITSVMEGRHRRNHAHRQPANHTDDDEQKQKINDKKSDKSPTVRESLLS